MKTEKKEKYKKRKQLQKHSILFLVDEEWCFPNKLPNNVEVVFFASKQFKNGEIYCSLPVDLLRNYEKVVLCTRYAGDANTYIMKILLLAKQIRFVNNNIALHIILPYLPYSRHDKSYDKNIQPSLQAIISLLSDLNVEELVVVDAHNPEFFDRFDASICNLGVEKLWADKIKSLHLNNPIIVFPDCGSDLRGKKITDFLGLESICFDKTRHHDSNVDINLKNNQSNFIKKDCIIVDDIIHSCSTIASVVKYLRHLGVNNIYCCITHADFTVNAVDMLRSLRLSGVFITNTIDFRKMSLDGIEVISIESLIYNYLELLNKVEVKNGPKCKV